MFSVLRCVLSVEPVTCTPVFVNPYSYYYSIQSQIMKDTCWIEGIKSHLMNGIKTLYFCFFFQVFSVLTIFIVCFLSFKITGG